MQKVKKSLGCIYDGETKSGYESRSIILDYEEALPFLVPDEKGKIRLTALRNTYKENETQPDFNILKPQAKQTATASAKPQHRGVGARPQGSKFPFNP